LANLETAAAELGKAAYEAAAADTAEGEKTADSAPSTTDGDDVIDAEFEVKED
jgi:hypothetical protein